MECTACTIQMQSTEDADDGEREEGRREGEMLTTEGEERKRGRKETKC